MNGWKSVAAAAVAGVVFGCGAGPRPGDSLLLTAPVPLWRARDDLRKFAGLLATDPGAAQRMLSDSDGGAADLLHEGTTVQVTQLAAGAYRVRVVTDGAPDWLKRLHGDHTGRLGYITRTAPVADVPR